VHVIGLHQPVESVRITLGHYWVNPAWNKSFA
jgi:hypothetical protein